MDGTSEIRRFGFYMRNQAGSTDITVIPRPLDEEDFDEFRRLIAVVFHVQPTMMAILSVTKNYEDFRASLDEIRSRLVGFSAGGTVPNAIDMDMFMELARRITNFLAAASAFLSQTETHLAEVLGADSTEFARWNDARKLRHKTSFAFRFLYDLRNYCQHCDLPLSNLHMNGRRSAENNSMSFEVSPQVSRDSLLAGSFSWKTSVRDELARQAESVDLVPLLDEYAHLLCDIAVDAIAPFGTALLNCGKYLTTVVRLINAPEKSVVVLFVGESPASGGPPGRVEIVPLAQFAWLQSQSRYLATF